MRVYRVYFIERDKDHILYIYGHVIANKISVLVFKKGEYVDYEIKVFLIRLVMAHRYTVFTRARNYGAVRCLRLCSLPQRD